MSVTKISLRKRLALNLFKKYKDNERSIHQLNYILWECTLRCNLRCLHCGSDCRKEASQKDMPANDFLKAIDEIVEMVVPHNTMIVLTGGEPLLRIDLEQVGISLYKRGFPWGIVTNGMLLSERRLNALILAGLRSITVSLDGLEESHNWLRGSSGSYSAAIHAISLLPSIPGIQYDVVTCVNQRNFHELRQLKELLMDMGVKKWRIFTIFPVGRAKAHNELQLEPVDFKGLFDFIVKTRKEGTIKLSYGCEGFLASYEQEVRDHFFMCRAGINIASILADGSISACPNLRESFIQGNIYKDNFREVWENRYDVFRNRSWTKTGICSACEFYKYCEGNGMHLRDGKTGELMFCHLKRMEEGERMSD